MPFTAQEISNIQASVIDFHERGKVNSQVIQIRPLVDDLLSSKKTFPGGRDYITWRVKGVYSTAFQGYSGDDQVSFTNPANIRQAQTPWYELHAGISFTQTELTKAGISVVDTNGANTTTHSQAELIQLTDLLEDKLEDMEEGSMRSFDEIVWRDGTQDPLVFPGIQSFITATPTTGTVFGLDRATNVWWRNRAVTGIDTSTPSNCNLINTLETEILQLRRYRPNAKHKIFAGSDWVESYQKELRSKGNVTLSGWMDGKAVDAGMADPRFKGLMIQYAPILDDLGQTKDGFVLDLSAIKLRPIEGEEFKKHNPARPPERYVVYHAKTWKGALTAIQLNSSGLYRTL